MKFIYHCFGGSHSSVTASAIHAGILPEERLATSFELLSIPYFDSQISLDHGRIRFVGWDEKGAEIYLASKRGLGKDYERIMSHILRLADNSSDHEQIVFINTMPVVNLFMVIGGYLSRRLGSCILGRTIVAYGTRQAYHKFVLLVRQVKETYHSSAEVIP